MLPRSGIWRGKSFENRGRGNRGYGNRQHPYNQPRGAFEGRGGGRRGRHGENLGYGRRGRHGENLEYGNARGGRAPSHGRGGPGAFQGYEPEVTDETFEAPPVAMQPMATPERLVTGSENLETEGVGQKEHCEQGSSSRIPFDVAASHHPLVAPTESADTSEDSRKAALVSSTAIAVLSRPGFGVNGKEARIRVNHFKVDLGIDTIYHYDVDIQPKIAFKPTARRLISSLIPSYINVEHDNRLPVFDGSKSMYSVVRFAFDEKLFDISLLDEHDQNENTNRQKERKFQVTIRLVATLDLKSLRLFLEAKQTHIPQEILQALDIVLRETPRNFYVPVGRSFFHKDMGVLNLGGGLEGWTGFYQSLRPTMQGLALNIDLSTTAFVEDIDVIDFLHKILPNFSPDIGLIGSDVVEARKSLMHLKVQVKHRQTSQNYRIAGLSELSTCDITFEKNGQEISLVKYFLDFYNFPINYSKLPSLLVNRKRRIYLPMEACKVSSGQKYSGKLSESQKKKIVTIAAKTPAERENHVLNILRQKNAPGCDQFSRDFGIAVTRKFTEIHARTLCPPKLRYGRRSNPISPSKGGRWDLMHSEFVVGASIKNWAFLDFSGFGDRKLRNFVDSLTGRCYELGMDMNPFPVVSDKRASLNGNNTDNNNNNIEELLKRLNADANRRQKRLQLIICLMNKRSPLYANLKRVSETDIGVVTQCCLTKGLNWDGKGTSQYLANLAMKINVKTGGTNVVFFNDLPNQLPDMFGVPTIIFGADVTHPAANDDSSPSIAAIVANVDWPTAAKYVARIRAQSCRGEIIVDLENMVHELLKEYCQKSNFRRPEKVIFFRDGVGEGQFYAVLDQEFCALLKAFESFESDYRPKVTWVVVQKRHHTRFIPADRNLGGQNVSPGTIVDQVITHPREFDFYLCSHAGIQGTSRPAHYHVLLDENNFTADELQGLINDLCYTYARCTSAVSYVTPAYYAHLAAYHARLYLDSSGSGCDRTSMRGGSLGTSSTHASGSGALAPAIQILRQPHDDIQSVMYYC